MVRVSFISLRKLLTVFELHKVLDKKYVPVPGWVGG
jgi:hypothetical protein